MEMKNKLFHHHKSKFSIVMSNFSLSVAGVFAFVAILTVPRRRFGADHERRRSAYRRGGSMRARTQKLRSACGLRGTFGR